MRSGFSRQDIDFMVGAAGGAICGMLLFVAGVLLMHRLTHQQYEAHRIFSALSQEERLELRSEWMDAQLARAFGQPSLMADDIWQDYRVIFFPYGNRQLLCAPQDGPVETGFIFANRNGLKTVMPSGRLQTFEILLLCSIRI